ncbi:MAG: hypothetical protein WCE61_22850, partial [Candidatus Acidiferrum sp.]
MLKQKNTSRKDTEWWWISTYRNFSIEFIINEVHHQRLLNRLKQQVHDSRILDVVKRMLTAKVVMPDGTKVATIQGIPQGGPLTPRTQKITMPLGGSGRVRARRVR